LIGFKEMMIDLRRKQFLHERKSFKVQMVV